MEAADRHSPVRECFENGADVTGMIYLDYRGVPVYGASSCQKHFNFVPIAEFDVAEILAPI